MRQAAHGVHTITDAPRLEAVQPDTNALGTSPYPEFLQRAAETVVFDGRQVIQGVLWTDGVLYPDYLGIGFTERLADVPQFVAGVQQLSGQPVTSVRGTASLAGVGDPPLLGDWIRTGRFQPDRLARRFDSELGGRWDVIVRLKNFRDPAHGYAVEINRRFGT